MAKWNVPATLAWIASGNDALCGELEAIPNASFLELSVRLAVYKLDGLIPEHPTIKEIKRALLEALQSGKVRGWAVKNRKGNRILIW
jgi:hypothetical protein